MTTRSASGAFASKLTLGVAIILTGLSAGFFATYQYSVTRALSVVDDRTYVVAFQAINNSIRSTEFGVIFFGSLMALLIALALALTNLSSRKVTTFWLVCALIAYVTTLVITFFVHIPLNDALAAVNATAADVADLGRQAFEVPWNDMHLIRSLTALAAFVSTVLALVFSDRPRDVRT